MDNGKIRVYSSSDYAGIKSKNFSAYYGYEITDGNDDWCFQAKFNGEVITIPFSKLGCKNNFDCVKCLNVGIAWIFMKYKLTL